MANIQLAGDPGCCSSVFNAPRHTQIGGAIVSAIISAVALAILGSGALAGTIILQPLVLTIALATFALVPILLIAANRFKNQIFTPPIDLTREQVTLILQHADLIALWQNVPAIQFPTDAFFNLRVTSQQVGLNRFVMLNYSTHAIQLSQERVLMIDNQPILTNRGGIMFTPDDLYLIAVEGHGALHIYTRDRGVNKPTEWISFPIKPDGSISLENVRFQLKPVNLAVYSTST